MVKSYIERLCAVNTIEISKRNSQINVLVSIWIPIIAKLYKHRPVFQCKVHIMRALVVDFSLWCIVGNWPFSTFMQLLPGHTLMTGVCVILHAKQDFNPVRRNAFIWITRQRWQRIAWVLRRDSCDRVTTGHAVSRISRQCDGRALRINKSWIMNSVDRGANIVVIILVHFWW